MASPTLEAGHSFPDPEYSPGHNPQQVRTGVGKRSLAPTIDRAQTADKASETLLARPGTVRTAGEQGAKVEECVGDCPA